MAHCILEEQGGHEGLEETPDEKNFLGRI